MVINRMKRSSYGETYKSYENQIISEPVKKRKSRYNEETRWFKNAFVLFCSFNLVLSLGILIKNAVVAINHSESYDTPKSCPDEAANSLKSKKVRNLYDVNFSFDFYAFLGGNEMNIDHESSLIWTKKRLTYGDLQSIFSFSTNVPISERIRSSGSLYLHVYLTKSGSPPGRPKEESWTELYTLHKTKRLNFYGKSVEDPLVRSYWLSNWTVNLVVTESEFSMSKLSGKHNGFFDCDPLTSKYYPILYLNNKYNLAKDCIQIDRTTEWLPLNLTFKQISLGKPENYLRQRDPEESFGRRNLTYEDAVRARQIENDLEIHFSAVIWISIFFGVRFWALTNVNLSMQVAFLTVIKQKFDLIGYTPQEFLAFALAWLLGEFAILIYYWEMDIVSNWQHFLRRRCLFSAKNIKGTPISCYYKL